MEAVTCPICGRRMPGPPREWPCFPFCRQRCKLIDLGRWLDGAYALPPEEPDPEEPDLEESP